MEGAMLRKFRGERKQKDVACQVCIAPSTLSKYESGKLPIPPDVVVQVAVFYDRPEILDAYCASCPVMRFLGNRRFGIIKGGKAA